MNTIEVLELINLFLAGLLAGEESLSTTGYDYRSPASKSDHSFFFASL